VVQLLSNINSNQPSGPDEMSSRVLKTFTEELAPILTTIYTALGKRDPFLEYLCFVHLLLQYSPYAVMKWIQIWPGGINS